MNELDAAFKYAFTMAHVYDIHEDMYGVPCGPTIQHVEDHEDAVVLYMMEHGMKLFDWQRSILRRALRS